MRNRAPHRAFGGYLVTRLDGYTQSDAEALVTRSLAAEIATIADVHGGKVLLDMQPTFKYKSTDVAGQPLAVTGPISDESDYGSWNADMVKAGDLLIARNIPTELDRGEMFVGDRSNLLGYFSWAVTTTSTTREHTNLCGLRQDLSQILRCPRVREHFYRRREDSP
jgi:hypothetical protein